MIPALILATHLDSLADQNPIIVRNQIEGSASPVELLPRSSTLKRFEERSLSMTLIPCRMSELIIDEMNDM